MTVWLRADEHDRLIRLAQKHDTSVSAVARHLLTRRLRDQPDDKP
jgi:cytidylate kinase